jgi:hypothetical protein
VPEKTTGKVEVRVSFDSGPLAGVLRTSRTLEVQEATK